MPYQDDLPNLFAELPNLIIAGYGDPASLGTIWSTGKLPEPEPSGPTLADLEEQFQQEQGDVYSDILSSTGDPFQASSIASSLASGNLHDAVNQSMIDILSGEDYRTDEAARQVMMYEGPLDPDMNVADIVAPIYGVSPTKVEAVLKTEGAAWGALEESYAKPFYEMDLDQPISVQPEIININKPVPMAGDTGFNQAIDNYGEPPGTMITPAADVTGLSAPQQASPVMTSSELIAQRKAWDPTGKRTLQEFWDENYGGVQQPYTEATPWADLGSSVWGALTQDWGELSEEQRQTIIQQQQLKVNQGQPVDPFSGQPPETVPTPIAPVPVSPQRGDIADDPGVAAQRALNDEIILGKVREVARIFEDFNTYQYNPGGVSSGPGAPDFTDDYFRNLIKSYIDSPEGQASTYADLGPEHFMRGWGENQRFAQVVTSSEADPGTTIQGQPTVDTTVQTTEVPAATGPLTGSTLDPIVDSDTWAFTLNAMKNQAEFDYVGNAPSGEQLYVGPGNRLWGLAPDLTYSGLDQITDFGQMTQIGDTDNYQIQNQTWQNVNGMWSQVQAAAAPSYAPGGDIPFGTRLAGMRGDPVAQWEAMRTKEMGQDIWNPVQWGTRMQGFQPAYGKYLLSGQRLSGDPFYQFMGGGTRPDVPPEVDLEQAWREMVAVSGAGGVPAGWQAADMDQFSRMATYQSLLGPTSDQAKQNAILMAATAMGAGEGVGAQALNRQLGSMWDVQAAEAAAAGQPVGGFINWLNQQITPGSMPGTGL